MIDNTTGVEADVWDKYGYNLGKVEVRFEF